MPRYTSVQAFADNDSGVRKVQLDESAKEKKFVQPEKVVNPYSSTSGAGSGEFHVYRHARNREMERQRQMNRTNKQQKLEEEHQKKIAANKEWEDQRTAKRRRKRERQKEAKKRKENLAKAGISLDGGQEEGDQMSDNQEDEFAYTPGAAVAPLETIQEEQEEPSSTADTPVDNNQPDTQQPQETATTTPVIPNDGSFLEMMKAKLAQSNPEAASKSPQQANAPSLDDGIES